MIKVSKGLLAKKYAYNLVGTLLKLAVKQETSSYLPEEIKVEWISRNQLQVTGVSVDKKGKKSEFGTTLKVLRDLIQNNNPQLITDTEAKIKAKSEKEQDLRTDNVNTVIATIGSNPKPLEIGNECVNPKEVERVERYIIEQIRNSIRYLEELKLLKDQRPRNHQGKVAGTPYWKFKLINLKGQDATLEENLREVIKKLELRPSQSHLLESHLLDTSVGEISPLSSAKSGEMSGEMVPSSSLNSLAQQMRSWFETLGYGFENNEVSQDNYFEWVINIPVRRKRYDRILVRGMTGEVGLKDVRALSSKVEEKRTDEGWLVTNRRISKAARSEIKKKEKENHNFNLECFTFDELVTMDADFSGYVDWLKAEIKKRGIDQKYVHLACRKEELDPDTKDCIGVSHYTEEDGWIDGYINRWLDDPAKEHISILGEFGTGKTWFVLHYAWVALKRYQDAQDEGVQLPRLPLVISLRDYAKAVSVESLFSEFFFRQHEIPIPGYSAFEQLNRMGKLLLIFDGFDEMASRINRQEMINNFWELAKVVVPGAKVILTCRTEHFPEAQEGRALLNAELQASITHVSGETPQFEVLELEKFNDEQIRQLLSHQAEDATVEKVMGNPELLDLARRPVMTELILEALPDIKAGKPIDMSRVYLYAVKRKMERDIKAERTFTSLADKLYFLCELSWEMLSTDQMSLNYRQFPDRIRRLFGAIVQKQKDLDHWHYDMMGQTMLIRNADGDYTPAHRSLLEFFVAYKFAAELGVLAEDFTELARREQGHSNNHSPTDYTWSSYFRSNVHAQGNIVSVAPLGEFVSESFEKLLKTVGKTPLAKAVIDLLVPMIRDNQSLIKVLKATRGKTPDKVEVGYIGGNAASLAVRFDKEALQGRDLSYLMIKEADFSEANLRSVNFVGTNLTGCVFIKIFDSVAWIPNEVTVVSGSEDGTIEFRDVNTGNCVKTLKSERPYEGMNITGVKGLTPAEIDTLKALGAIVPKNIPDDRPIEKLQSFEFETVTVNARGEITKREQKQASYFVEPLTEELGIEMVAIPEGTFLMGSPEDERGHDKNQSPQHTVTVQPFFMGKYPVTQAQWRFVAQLPPYERELKTNPSYFKGDNLPVEQVSWYDAEEFCKRLSKHTGRKYRLPSEAEWEYACRAGTTTPFSFGETITGELANYGASNTFAKEAPREDRVQTTEVRLFLPNFFGLYDMHGNVWNWCFDNWHSNYEEAPIDGSTWLKENNKNDSSERDRDLRVLRRVLRGGSWSNNPADCRSALRYRDFSDLADKYSGFRVVCSGVPSRILQ